MRYKSFIYVVILAFVTVIGLWGLPALVNMATYDSQKYPFVYYSSVLEEFCLRKNEGKKAERTDESGRKYTQAAFDSVMPLFSYRQLMVNGKMPDSIHGQAIDPKLLRLKSFVYKYTPKDIYTPDPGLYIMYESLSGRVSLESPGDLFRLKDKIEFIDAETNAVNKEKSDLFQSELKKRGYIFPARWTSGNMNVRKPYDEGYFSLDAKGKLFHIKMVNGRPFVRNTQAGDKVDIVRFSILEVADKRFYGFVHDKQGNTYILEGNEGAYLLKQLDVPPIDLKTEELMVMANMLYWTVSITHETGKRHFALRNDDLKKVRELDLDYTPTRWDKLSVWLFPAILTFSDKDSDYLYPRVELTGCKALLLNLLCACVLAVFFLIRGHRKKSAWSFIYILITGIAGVIAVLAVPGTKKSVKK